MAAAAAVAAVAEFGLESAGVAASHGSMCTVSLSGDDGDRGATGGSGCAAPFALVGECGCRDAEEEDAPDDGGGLDELASLHDPAASVTAPVSSAGGVAAASGGSGSGSGGGAAATGAAATATVLRAPAVASLCAAVLVMSSVSPWLMVIVSMAMCSDADRTLLPPLQLCV